MNLKEAANRLGVHYQTAYKWVRGGTLTAIRVGGRYEVSDAAVERFASRREAARREPPTAAEHEPGTAGPTAEDVLEELEAMATDPFVSTRSIAGFVARRGAELFGDLCVVMCFDRDGTPTLQVVDHPSPAHASLITAAIETVGSATQSPGFAFTAYAHEAVTRLSHVPQDVLRDLLRPQLRQHLALNPIRSLLAVPVSAGGVARGSVTFARSRPDQPHTDAEVDVAVEMSARVGRLLEAAGDVELAVAAREDLVRALGHHLNGRRPATLPEAARVARSLVDASGEIELPLAILDAQLRILATNRAFRTIRGEPASAVGEEWTSLTHPEHRTADRASFDRLLSGELDYLDSKIRRIVPDGREFVYMSHRAAVRAADASLRYVITVARPLRLPEADYSSVAPAPYRAPAGLEDHRAAG